MPLFFKFNGNIFQDTQHQRCWVHKTDNVLTSLSKGIQVKVKAELQEIWLAEKRPAMPIITQFIFCWQYFSKVSPAAMKKLKKNREELLAFYNFPSAHYCGANKNDECCLNWLLCYSEARKTKGEEP
ncbi:MAG: transposase [Arsenophonus sp. NEOnobi-MAG3]